MESYDVFSEMQKLYDYSISLEPLRDSLFRTKIDTTFMIQVHEADDGKFQIAP